MTIPLDTAKKMIGWLAFLLPTGIALPNDLFYGCDVIVMVSFYLGLIMPLIWYVLCLVDGLRTLPKKHRRLWLLIFHFVKVPLVLLGLLTWYSFLCIRGFFSNGIPAQT